MPLFLPFSVPGGCLPAGHPPPTAQLGQPASTGSALAGATAGPVCLAKEVAVPPADLTPHAGSGGSTFSPQFWGLFSPNMNDSYCEDIEYIAFIIVFYAMAVA